ncbi:MAG TPA: CHAT domain-containing protein, partial [Ktedonobacterales bacterium]|nr:CHAT domain-containing protein [Ktedonobacterales bacterium]
DSSLQLASQRGMGLRLKLYIQAPELAALPWEYLYDPRLGEYLCLSRSTPLVHTLESLLPIQPFTVQPPLRILGMIASPNNLDPLDIAREQARMRAALQPLEDRHLVRLKWLEGQTWRDLQRAMLGGPWHIFHFSGHGGFDTNIDEGMLALTDDQGQAHLLRAAEVGRLLADHPSLRLVVLNACEGARGGKRDIFSSTAATLARRGIPAVIAMQEEITDPAAIELTRALYEALALGKPVDEALAVARTAISLGLQNTLEWGTPVLYLRSQDGMLFNLPAPATTTLFPPLTPPVAPPERAAPAPPLRAPEQAKPPIWSAPPAVAPAKLMPRKSRLRRVAVATMGTLRALGGAGVGFLIGIAPSNGGVIALGIAGLALGGASGVALAILEEKARQGAAPLANNIMRVERAVFAAALGLLTGLTFFSGRGSGAATLAAIIGALLGGALSAGFIQIEKRARSGNQRGLRNLLRTIRTLFKGGIGFLGGMTLGGVIGLILIAINPPTITSGSQPGNIGDAIGQAIAGGLAAGVAAIATVLVLAVLVGLVGLIVGLIAGAIVEFRAD